MTVKIKQHGPRNSTPLSVSHPVLSMQWDEAKKLRITIF